MKDADQYSQELALLRQTVKLQKKVIEDGIEQHKTLSVLVQNTHNMTDTRWYQEEIRNLRKELAEERERSHRQQTTLGQLFQSLVQSLPLLPNKNNQDINASALDTSINDADYASFEQTPVDISTPAFTATADVAENGSSPNRQASDLKCPTCWAKLDGESHCFSCGNPIHYSEKTT